MDASIIRVVAAALFVAATLLAGIPAGAEDKCNEGEVAVPVGGDYKKIAEKELGDVAKWKDIRDANPGVDPMALRVGQCIKLPTVQPPKPQPASTTPAAAQIEPSFPPLPAPEQQLESPNEEATLPKAVGVSASARKDASEALKASEAAERAAKEASHLRLSLGATTFAFGPNLNVGGTLGIEVGPERDASGLFLRLGGVGYYPLGSEPETIAEGGVGGGVMTQVGWTFGSVIDAVGTLLIATQIDPDANPRLSFGGAGGGLAFRFWYLRFDGNVLYQYGRRDPLGTPPPLWEHGVGFIANLTTEIPF